MAVPDFQSLMLPLLKVARDGQPHSLAEAVDTLAQEFQLSDEDRNYLLKSGQTRLYNRVGWTKTYLKKAGLIQSTGAGRFQLTARGAEVLATGPATIDVAFLESLSSDIAEFRKSRPKGEATAEEPPATYNIGAGAWDERVEVMDRIRETMERSVPDKALRRDALQVLAMAIENADEERGDAWYLRETEHGLRLMAGRLYACEVVRSQLRVSVIGPIADDVRATLGAEPEHDEEFRFKVILSLPRSDGHLEKVG